MHGTRTQDRRRNGSVMMETVIAMPILLLLIFVVLQFAHVWMGRQFVSYAAFCATRAIAVVAPAEQPRAALDAAQMALSWMCLADQDEPAGAQVTVPGWGEVLGARSRNRRVAVQIVQGLNGTSDTQPVAAVKVVFNFPLLISGMAVNKIIGTVATAAAPALNADDVDFYRNLDRMAGNPTLIDGWPYIPLAETCVLPMPYSTANFPTGGFTGCSFTGGEN